MGMCSDSRERVRAVETGEKMRVIIWALEFGKMSMILSDLRQF